MSDVIDEMKTRIETAEKVERELTGKKREGITLQRIGAYTIVDDGQDKWICETETYDNALEDILTDILADKFNPIDEEGLDVASYDRLCGITGCLYSKIGINTDVAKLCAELDCDARQFAEIVDALQIAEETLPAIMILLNTAGTRYAGDSAHDIAVEWIDNDFDAESCAEWIAAGFWNPSTAAQLLDAGLSPDDAKNAADAMTENESDNDYTDGCPIYAACNGDIPAQEIIDAHKLATT